MGKALLKLSGVPTLGIIKKYKNPRSYAVTGTSPRLRITEIGK
jgi:hypothetical protein